MKITLTVRDIDCVSIMKNVMLSQEQELAKMSFTHSKKEIDAKRNAQTDSCRSFFNNIPEDVANSLSDDNPDNVAIALANCNKEKIKDWLQEVLNDKGITLTIDDLTAEK